MNPTYDNSIIGAFNANSHTDTITIGSNPNTILVVAMTIVRDNRTVTPSIGGNNFTQYISADQPFFLTSLQLYYYLAPPTGSQTITFQVDASNTASVAYTVYSYYNVNQGVPDNGTTFAATGLSMTHTLSLTPNTPNSMWIGFGYWSNNFTITGIPNHQNTIAAAGGLCMGDSGLVSTSTSFTLTSSQQDQLLMGAITLSPVPVPQGGAFLYEYLTQN